MKGIVVFTIAIAFAGSPVPAQETKPVPKDSIRISIPGCSRGYVFTAGPRTTDEPGMFEIPEGMHLRMNAPKKLMSEIKAHEGSRIEITGLMKRGQYRDGVSLGGGVRIMPPPSAPGALPSPTAGQMQIDVEGWRPLDGPCRTSSGDDAPARISRR